MSRPKNPPYNLTWYYLSSSQRIEILATRRVEGLSQQEIVGEFRDTVRQVQYTYSQKQTNPATTRSGKRILIQSTSRKEIPT